MSSCKSLRMENFFSFLHVSVLHLSKAGSLIYILSLLCHVKTKTVLFYMSAKPIGLEQANRCGHTAPFNYTDNGTTAPHTAQAKLHHKKLKFRCIPTKVLSPGGPTADLHRERPKYSVIIAGVSRLYFQLLPIKRSKRWMARLFC